MEKRSRVAGAGSPSIAQADSPNATANKTVIEELMPHPYFTFIHQDVCTPVTLKVDEIYNLACPASPAYYQKYPIQTTKSSVLGIINMLELARANDCKLLQASTSEVYGDPDVHP